MPARRTAKRSLRENIGGTITLGDRSEEVVVTLQGRRQPAGQHE
jgi:hypothetical protein